MPKWTGYTLITNPTGTATLLVDNGGPNLNRVPIEDLPVAVSVFADNVLAVSGTNGSDTNGVVGRLDKPVQTPAGAVAKASSGVTVSVNPGTYAIASNLLKTGVDWDCAPGVELTATSTDSANQNIFDDLGAAVVSTITGHAAILCTGDSPTYALNASCVYITNPSSDVRISARSVTMDIGGIGESGVGSALNAVAGRLWVDADAVEATGVPNYAVWWQNGDMRVRAHQIITDSTQNSGAAVLAQVQSTPTGDCHVVADEILSTQAGGPAAISAGSNQTEAKLWISAPLISAFDGNAVSCQGGKVYIRGASKIVGCTASGDASSSVITIGASGGTSQVWINSQKVTGTYGTAIEINGGTSFITLQQIEDLGHLTQAVNVTAGTLELEGAVIVILAGNGVNISGGTLRLKRCRIDTSAVAGGYPIVMSTGTLVLEQCVLVAHSGQDSIHGTGTVVNYGSHANTAKAAGITVHVDTLTVDANVI